MNIKWQLLLLATPLDNECSTCSSPRNKTRPVKVLLSGQEAQTGEAAEMWPDRSDGNSEAESQSQRGWEVAE